MKPRWRNRTNNKRMEVLLAAFTAGYRCTYAGDVISPRMRTLKLRPYGGGQYPAFAFRYQGSNFNVFAHRLHALQLFGASAVFQPDILVRHMNDTKTDCSRRNLKLGTDKDNYHDNPAWKNEKTKQNLNVASKPTESERASMNASIDTIGF